MKYRDILFKIIFEGFIQIREDSVDSNRKSYLISHLLHNLPLLMNKDSLTEDDYRHIHEELRKSSDSFGLIKWLKEIEGRNGFKE